MSDPFLVEGPAAISFSGGRTSAYMLWRILRAHQWILPPDVIVLFANTGKEEEATLRFVRACSTHWNVPITWLEYRNDECGYAVVDFDNASRNGEPFEAIIRKRQYLPNPVTRFCTVELKIHTMHRHIKSLGWPEWDQVIGIRSDEPGRVAKFRSRGGQETVRETVVMPLADAGVTVRDVSDFWSRQVFDLELPNMNGRTMHGNCDLCFLKGAKQVQSLIQEKPQRADWWARMEALALASKPSGAVFRSDRPSYATMQRMTSIQPQLIDDEPLPCFCGE